MVAPQVGEVKKPEVDATEIKLVLTQSVDPPKPEVWTRKEIVLSAIGFLCCNIIGLPALILSIFSYVDFSSKQYEASKKKRQTARRLAIAAIILGLLMVITMCAYYKFCPIARKHHPKGGFRNDDVEVPEHMKGLIRDPEAMKRMMQMKGEWERHHQHHHPHPCPPGPHPCPPRPPGPRPETSPHSTTTEVEMTFEGTMPAGKIFKKMHEMMGRLKKEGIPIEQISSRIQNALKNVKDTNGNAINTDQIRKRLQSMMDHAKNAMKQNQNTLPINSPPTPQD